MSQVGSSCPALCPGEPGLVACQAHHFLVCTMETPLCSLSRAEGTFDFKSCRNMCLNSGHCSLSGASTVSLAFLWITCPEAPRLSQPRDKLAYLVNIFQKQVEMRCAVLAAF